MTHDETIVTELAEYLGRATGSVRVLPMSAAYAAPDDPAWMVLELYNGRRYVAKVWRARLAGDHRPKKKPRAAAKKKPAKRGRK